MHNEPTNWEQEWQGLEPEPPRRRRRVAWLAGTLLLLILLGACSLGGYLAWQRLDLWLTPDPLLLPPTTESPSDDAGPTSTPLSLAPTATLNQPGETSSSIPAGWLATQPQIDADLSDWNGRSATESAFLVYQADSWDGSDDVTAAWRLGWDSENLYVAVEVSDDIHVQTQTGNQIFRGDGVSLQIDTDRERDWGSGLSADDVQINLSPGDFVDLPPSAFRFVGGQDAPGADVRLTARATATGYVLEAAIPWGELGVTPESGLVLGLALNVNDNDTPGTAVQEILKSHVATRTFSDPTTWGALSLEE